MRTIPSSELIINSDGSVFHLHLKPEELADTVILVGDPGRVTLVARHFDSCETERQSREFHTITGTYKGKRLSVVSTGIGSDNIDIVMTELDALANVDFATRQSKAVPTSLTILRLGTSGALQNDIPLGSLIFSHTSIGMDGVLNYYKGRDNVCDLDMERSFVRDVKWDPRHAAPYAINASEELYSLFSDVAIDGITLSAIGFYAPQGRWIRLEPNDTELFTRIREFRYNGRRITNCEMEGAAIAGMAALMGHRAGTMCVAIAQRAAHTSNADYTPYVERMIQLALDRLAGM